MMYFNIMNLRSVIMVQAGRNTGSEFMSRTSEIFPSLPNPNNLCLFPELNLVSEDKNA